MSVSVSVCLCVFVYVCVCVCVGVCVYTRCRNVPMVCAWEECCQACAYSLCVLGGQLCLGRARRSVLSSLLVQEEKVQKLTINGGEPKSYAEARGLAQRQSGGVYLWVGAGACGTSRRSSTGLFSYGRGPTTQHLIALNELNHKIRKKTQLKGIRGQFVISNVFVTKYV